MCHIKSRLVSHSLGLQWLWSSGMGAEAMSLFLLVLSSDAILKSRVSGASVFLEFTWIQFCFIEFPEESIVVMGQFAMRLRNSGVYRLHVEGPLTSVITAVSGSWIFLFLPLGGLKVNLDRLPGGVDVGWCAVFSTFCLWDRKRRGVCLAVIFSFMLFSLFSPRNIFHYFIIL